MRAGGRRLEARANGASARALADRLAGEVVALRGEVAPVEGDAGWLASRHVSGRLTILAVDEVRPGHPVSRLANGLRRTLVAGAATLRPRASGPCSRASSSATTESSPPTSPTRSGAPG